MDSPRTVITIGIAGASGSGKTVLANALRHALQPRAGEVLSQDHYYRDISHLSYEERCRENFDHPDAIDFALLARQFEQLKKGRDIDHPVYDFSTHLRQTQTAHYAPQSIVILEGILILSRPDLCRLLDHKIFVDTPADICLIRRLRRDMRERSRNIESVLQQYERTVRPMFLEYVQPSQKQADLTVSGEEDSAHNVQMILQRFRMATT
ncbi:MAG TPA: uridine kinase [bacterium]|nr:uridine kinase [bacterium]HNT64284.1 uridine kinase [bacterium]